MYKRFGKRLIDTVLSLIAFIILSPASDNRTSSQDFLSGAGAVQAAAAGAAWKGLHHL